MGYNQHMARRENWDMIGHHWAVQVLRGHISRGRIRHAYLITGPRGVGRRTLALRAAQALNCPQPIEAGIPCASCNTCRRIERQQHPDLLVVQAEEETLKVEQIRSLQQKLALLPYEARYKIALLLNFESANESAANALLKTLEEPPSRVILFLTALDSEVLLPTIRSRCELIRLRPLPYTVVAEGLQTHATLPADEANLLAHLSNGCPGLALHLHRQRQALEQRTHHLAALKEILQQDRVTRFRLAEQLAANKSETRQALLHWLSFWRDVLLVSSNAGEQVINLDESDALQQLAKRVSAPQAARITRNIQHTLLMLEKNVNPRLALEALLLQLP